MGTPKTDPPAKPEVEMSGYSRDSLLDEVIPLGEEGWREPEKDKDFQK